MRQLALAVLLLVAACSPPASPPAPGPAAATFSFDQAEAERRLTSIEPTAWSPAGEPFDHAEGFRCISRAAFSGEFTICSVPGGNVASVIYRAKGNGSDAALQDVDRPTAAFMALFETEPYTAADRARIHRDVGLALADDQSRFVAIDTYYVKVERAGRSFSLSAKPDEEPGA